MAPKVAVAGGTGGLGAFIVQAYIEAGGYEVVVLGRKGSSASAPQGATLAPVDYEDVDELASALQGVDTVVSSLGATAVGDPQFKLLEASIKAGVKRFVPSAFGADLRNPLTKGFHIGESKLPFHDKLKASPISWTIIDTGFFIDTSFFPQSYLGFDIANGKAYIVGDGEARVSLLHRKDIGRYVVKVLQAEDSKNKHITVTGESPKLNDVVKLVEGITGKPLEVKYADKEALQADITAKIGEGKFVETIIDQLALLVGKEGAYLPAPDNDAYPLDSPPISLEVYLTEELTKAGLAKA